MRKKGWNRYKLQPDFIASNHREDVIENLTMIKPLFPCWESQQATNWASKTCITDYSPCC